VNDGGRGLVGVRLRPRSLAVHLVGGFEAENFEGREDGVAGEIA
jgi:hypothetical protein